MIILDGANDKIEVVTGSAGDIEPSVSWVENNAGTMTPGGLPRASITTATTTDLITAPGASKQRAVKEVSLRNNHATDSNDVTVRRTDGTNTATLIKATLLAGEALVLDEVGVWTHYDINGGPYPALGNLATQAEMEAGSSNTVVATPGRLGYHPGVAKFWVLFTGNSTTILASYNMTSITDGTTEATVTIATDFSSANWAVIATAVAAVTTAAGARLASCRALAAGTVIVFCLDGQATPALADPTSWSVAGFGDQ